MNFPAHPSRSRCSRGFVHGLLAVVLLAAPAGAEQQTAPAADSVRSHRHARTLQTRFERLRLRNLPRVPDGGSHECDEIIGRLCVWDDGDDDWQPKEEPAAIIDGREDLLAGLDSLAELVPGDHWVLGQRIRYLVEAGRLEDAEAVARRCGLPGGWRCDAYLGFVLHHHTDFVRSESAFRRAIEAMPAEVREEWTSPGRVLGRDLRRWLSTQPDSATALARLWTLADPLFLVEGNDRWTGHMSRWSYAMSAERATNPYDINWGNDFTEVSVRYGWPIAWERSWPRIGQTRASVTGRDLPAAFRAFPPRDVLARGPDGGGLVIWEEEEEDHPRATYLPPYLDSLGELDAQVSRFWRAGHVVVVAAWRTPEFPRPERSPGDGRGPANSVPPAENSPPDSVLSGLFVEQGGALEADVRTMAKPGSTVRLSARVPWSDWGVVSLEAWVPELRSAYRLRAGVGLPPLPTGLFAISDLMLLESGAEPSGLDELEDVLRPGSEIGAGETLAVALEIYGLGSREVLHFSARVERRDESFLRRMGRRLRLVDRPDEVSIEWREEGPERPGPFLKTLQVGLSGLEPGEYTLVVEVSAPGRTTLTAVRRFTVR